MAALTLFTAAERPELVTEMLRLGADRRRRLALGYALALSWAGMDAFNAASSPTAIRPQS